MNIWSKVKEYIKSWIKRHIVDIVPLGLEDEFSEKYRRGWKKNKK